jgi:uncharacterized protein YecT (DUF1311 family)
VTDRQHAGEPPGDLSPELRPLLARYEIFGELGRGGMAVVYHGRERRTDALPAREVAIKVVSHRYTGDADAARRFAREAQTVAGLEHPNIVRTLAIEALGDDAAAIVSRYVPGETLRAALRAAGGPVDYGRAVTILRDLAAALAYAHARRIVHRDVKPENAFLEAGTGRALLADFGIARPLDVDSALTADGSAFGTPAYMAPEQIAGRPVDERTDVYALGLVGWEMLAGRRPWQGETLYAVLHRQQHEELPDLALLRPDIPAYLLAALQGALAKDPAGRWRDGAEFLRRLSPMPVTLPALADPEGDDETLGGGQTMRVTPAAGVDEWAAPADETDAGGVPRHRRRGLPAGAARRLAAAAAVVGALGVGGVLLARRQADAARRAQDAAVTGVSDAELDSLLREAAVRARAPSGPGVRSPPIPVAAPPRRTSALPAGAAAAPAAAPAAARAAQRAPRGVDVAASGAPGPIASAATGAGDVTGDARCRSAASADQRACLMAALDRADVGLTRDYQALIAELRRQAGGEREPAPVRALRAEQRAWIDARDRRCRDALSGREGALWGAARAPCFAALSERRAAELRARLASTAGAGAAADQPA